MTTEQTKTTVEPINAERMKDYFPLLTVIFEVAFDVLAKTPFDEASRKQLILETTTFFNAMKANIRGFPDNYDELTEEEQEAECKRVGSFIFFGGVMGLLAEAIKKMPIVESEDSDKVH